MLRSEERLLHIVAFFARRYMRQHSLYRLDIWRDKHLGVTRYHWRAPSNILAEECAIPPEGA